MIITIKNEVVIDIICEKQYALCLIKVESKMRAVPYSAIMWTPDDTIMEPKK